MTHGDLPYLFSKTARSERDIQDFIGQDVVRRNWGFGEAARRYGTEPPALMLSMVASVFELRQGVEMPSTTAALYEMASKAREVLQSIEQAKNQADLRIANV